MSYNGANLSQIAPGRKITVWGYDTDDPLEETVKAGYFKADTIQPGDRIEVNAGDGFATLAVRRPAKAGVHAGKGRVAVLAQWTG